jgi:hypothetical protein
MNNDNTGYKDPFADLDDGFGDDGFGLEDGLTEGQNNQQYFEEEAPLDTSRDFDEFGDPIVHDQAAPVYAEEEQVQQEYVAPTTAPQASVQASAKPFLKTPIGMASVGAGVFVLGLVGFVGIKSMGGSGETLTEAAPPGPEPLAPVAGDPNYDANTQPTQSSAATVIEPLPVKRLPTPAEQLAGATIEHAPAPVPVAEQHSPVPTQKLVSNLDEAPAISTPDEVTRLKAALSHQQEETENLKTAIASLTQGISKLSAYAEKDHEEQVQIKDQLETLVKRLEETPAAAPAAVTMPASKAPVTVNVDASKGVAKQTSDLGNPNAPGRYRLPGLKVIEATESGKMAVVTKASNGRTFTLFKGERLGTPRGSMTVTEVKDDGFLILVGDKYYIDKVSDEKPQAAPVVPAAKAEKPVKTVKRAEPAKQKQQSEPAVDSTAYTLNAVYDGGNSFGLVNSAGDFKSYRNGDELPGVGKITGLDANGNLKAGSKVIKSLY